jgi:hypothetical protein
MIFSLKPLLFIPVLLISFYSCNTKSPKTITQMEFTTDSTLADKPESDSLLQIKYSVPSRWQNFDPGTDVLKQVDTGLVRVSKMLKNDNGTVIFSLTDVRKVPDSIFRNIDEHYKTVLNPSGSWTNIEKADFETAGFNVKQYVMAKQDQTFFKMIFAERLKPSFQIDYSIMIDSAYALNTKTLESIIGSLKRVH